MPQCVASSPAANIPREWNYQSAAKNTGKDCIVTTTISAKDLQTLGQQIGLYGGNIDERSDSFTLRMHRNDPAPPSNRELRQRMIYKYVITVPHLDTFSAGGIKQGENQVAWTMETGVHAIELTGKLSLIAKAEDKNVCDRSTDSHEATSDKITRANEVIKENMPYILAAAKEFGVDPNAIAGVVYAEWSRNITQAKLNAEKFMAHYLSSYNPSNGIGQVKISTASNLESLGIINKSINRDEMVNRLYTPQENLRYVAAYLKYLGDLFPQVKNDPTMLIHLYNIGEYKKKGDPKSGLRTINSPPGYDCFAADAKNQFPYFFYIIKTLPIPQ